jgi:hypothetical protein
MGVNTVNNEEVRWESCGGRGALSSQNLTRLAMPCSDSKSTALPSKSSRFSSVSMAKFTGAQTIWALRLIVSFPLFSNVVRAFNTTGFADASYPQLSHLKCPLTYPDVFPN